MRILVISDSHGNTRNIERAVESQPEANIIIHLGDGADDIVDLEFYGLNICLFLFSKLLYFHNHRTSKYIIQLRTFKTRFDSYCIKAQYTSKK